jgi:hypothetical protein
VTPTSLTLTANAATKVYGQTLSFAGTEFTASGLENGETVGTVSLVAAGGTNATDAVGSYLITPGTAVGGTFNSANYTITYAPGTLTVTPLQVTVAAAPQTKVYGSADPVLTYAFSPALVVGDQFVGALGRAAGENVGAYAISQGTLSLDSNYALNYTGAALTVTPADLTVKADCMTKFCGQTVTLSGTEFTTVGLTNGDAVKCATLTCTGATNTLTPGSYPIIASAVVGSDLSNYSISYVPGTLTVMPGSPVTIKKPVVLGDGTIQLSFTGGNSGVSYQVQGSADFINWTTLTNEASGTNGLPIFIDTGATNNSLRFYRTVTP